MLEPPFLALESLQVADGQLPIGISCHTDNP